MTARLIGQAQAMMPMAAALTTDGTQLAVGDVIDLRDAIDVTIPERAVNESVNPWWLRMANSWHTASRQPGPIIADLVLASLAFSVTGSSNYGVALGAGVLLVAGLMFGLWKRRLPYETQGVLWFARHLTPSAAAVGFVLAVAERNATATQITLAATCMSACLTSVRAMLWWLISSARRQGMGLQPVLVVGPRARIVQIEHRLRIYPEAGLRLEAAHVPKPPDECFESGRELVHKLLAEHDTPHVLCVADNTHEGLFLDFVRFSKGTIDVSLVLPAATLCAGQVRSCIGDLGVLPLRLRPSWGSAAAKRAFDLAASVLAVIVLSPVLCLAALAVRLSDGGPALFKQKRVGRDGALFTIFKFRTMVVGAEDQQVHYLPHNCVNRGLLFKVDNDPRVTRVGALLRRFSIDELPQLFNVLRGEMSLVGPRPLAVGPEEFDIRAKIRHQTLPGITGVWQALGANALEYEDMLELDLAYVATKSFGVDLLTIFRTVPALLVRRAPY